MAEVYGNVNVNYSYCKSVAQLKSAADYVLGTKKEQIKERIQKTRPDNGKVLRNVRCRSMISCLLRKRSRLM